MRGAAVNQIGSNILQSGIVRKESVGGGVDFSGDLREVENTVAGDSGIAAE